MDGVHAAGRRARAFLGDDGVIAAGRRTAAAFDTFVLIDAGSADGAVQMHRVFRADFHTRMSETTHAALGDDETLLRAGVAGKLDNIDQRRCVVSLRTVRCFHVLGYRRLVAGVAARQAHGKTHSLSYDGSLQEHVISEVRHVPRDDLVRDFLNMLFHRRLFLIGHFGYLCKNHMTDILYSCLDSSHKYLSSYLSLFFLF